nr:carboxyl-terminal-processing peptidase 1, chloroplastic [Tanacetum cinerariifolium]
MCSHGAAKAVFELYEVVSHGLLSSKLRFTCIACAGDAISAILIQIVEKYYGLMIEIYTFNQIPPLVGPDLNKAEDYEYDEEEEGIQSTEHLQNGSSFLLHQPCYLLPPKIEGEFVVSDLVWGKVRSYPWWPDELLSINRVDVKGKPAFEALSLIQGPSDTSVKHDNCGPVQFVDVQRQLIARNPFFIT